MKRLFFILALLALLPGAVWNQITRPTAEVFSTVVKNIVFSLNGNSDSVVTAYPYSGQVVQVRIVPGTDDAAPANNYDLTILDPSGFDVLLGRGANLDSSATIALVDSLGWVNGTLSAVLKNAGANNRVKVSLWLK